MISVGPLPKELGATFVKSLNLSFNAFDGEIPEEFGDFEMIELIDLSENKLSGIVPMSLRKLVGTLRALKLKGNSQLCGDIPIELNGLDVISIEGTQIVGESIYSRDD